MESVEFFKRTSDLFIRCSIFICENVFLVFLEMIFDI